MTSNPVNSSIENPCKHCGSLTKHSNIHNCQICLQKSCGSCYFPLENLCKPCKNYINSLQTLAAEQLLLQKTKNSALTSQIITNLKALQETKNQVKKRIRDIKIVESTKSEINQLKQKFKASVNNLIIKEEEKNIINHEISGKANMLSEKCEDLERIGKEYKFFADELADSRDESKNSPKDAAGLFAENQTLREKLKGIDVEGYTFTINMVSALSELKEQILREKTEKNEKKTEEKKTEGLEDLKKKTRILIEELSLTKKQLISMRRPNHSETPSKANSKSKKFS